MATSWQRCRPLGPSSTERMDEPTVRYTVEQRPRVQALNAALGPLTGVLGMVGPTERITLAHLFGADRALTCRIATALHGLVLDDGSQPHGVSFTSKLGFKEHCWAVWLRALDDGKEVSSEPTRASGPHDISDTEHNPAPPRRRQQH